MEKKKIKQNKKDVVLIRFFIFVLAFIIILPVYILADSDFSNQPIPVVSSQSDASNGLLVCKSGGYSIFLSSNTSNCYTAFYGTGGTYDWVVATDINNPDLNNLSKAYYYSNTGQTISYNINNYYSHDNVNVLRYAYHGTAYAYNSIIVPTFETLDSALDAIYNFIGQSSSGDVVPLTTSYYTLDSGAYYKASENNKAAFALVGDIENGFTVVVGSIDPNCFIYKATDSTVSPVSLFRSNNLNLNNFYSNQNAGMIHPSGIDLSAFDNTSDAESAIYNYLVDEGGTPTATSSYSLSYSLPPGNVMFIDVSSAVGSITLETSSGISVSQNEFNNNNNQTIGYLASFPDSFTLPLSGTADIQWSASGNPTILGTYQKFQYTSAINSGGNQYLVIVNPTYDNLAISEGNLQADNPSATNSYIDIRCSAQNFYIFSLDAQISFSDGSWQLDSESSNTQFTGTYDPTTQTWNTTDSITGLPAQPTVGGANDIPTTDPAQAASNFTAWLKNFLSSFISIFDAGKTAITTLVGYAQPFFNTIGSLYSWLPAPVYAVLVSGLTLVVIVGVIKVFL